MSNLDLNHAPGCYGLGLTYQEKAQECVSCPFRGSCAPIAVARLAAMRAKYGVPTVVTRTVPAIPRPRISEASQTVMSPKVREYLRMIEGAGIRVTESLRNGVNPFPVTTKHFGPLRLTAALCLLCRFNHGFSLDQLKHALMTKLNRYSPLAAIQAAQSISVLTALGAIEETNGKYHLKRNS